MSRILITLLITTLLSNILFSQDSQEEKDIYYKERYEAIAESVHNKQYGAASYLIKAFEEAYPNDTEVMLEFKLEVAQAKNDYQEAIELLKVMLQKEEFKTIENYLSYLKYLKLNCEYDKAIKLCKSMLETRLEVQHTKYLRKEYNNLKAIINGDFTTWGTDLNNNIAQNTSASEISAKFYKDGFFVSQVEAYGEVKNLLINEGQMEITSRFDDAFVTNIQCLENNECYFSICEDIDCNIYMGTLSKDKLKNIIRLNAINKFGSQTTQPYIFKKGNSLGMVFSSNRAGGKGGYDLYWSALTSNGWLEAQPLGDNVNTPGNEITPFYNIAEKKLYFSSDYLPGFGGYDIFYAEGRDLPFLNKPINLGEPFNSCANDLYFGINEDNNKGMLSSNREGSTEGSSATCCNDIYQFTWPPETTDYKSREPIDKEAEYQRILAEINSFLPLKLYFHNDIPKYSDYNEDGVMIEYTHTYNAYTEMQDEYERKTSTTEQTIDFFDHLLPLEYSKYIAFKDLVQYLISENKSMNFTVKGSASPLASDEYNMALSQRRIDAILSDMYSNEPLYKGIVTDQLISVQTKATGEKESAKGISDVKSDPSSVYDIKAMLERKIEIQSVDFGSANTELASADKPMSKENGSGSEQSFSGSQYSIESESSGGNEFDTEDVTISNPYSETIKVTKIESSCKCSVVLDEAPIDIAKFGSIQIKVKRQLYGGIPQPSTLKIYAEGKDSWVISLD